MRIVIVGGGFVGTAVACHLLRNAESGTELTMLNSGGAIARGLAYGTRSPNHLLNVPVARMSWTAEQPNDFFNWLQNQGQTFHGHDFVRRSYYGDYLNDTLNAHLQHRSDLLWQSKHETVLRIQKAVGEKFALWTSEGRWLTADRVILALGNFAPKSPHHSLDALPKQNYVADPWQPDAYDSLSTDAGVCIIGTGLTMLDVLVSLRDGGHRGPVLALSRRGLVPLAHRSNELPPPGWLPSGPWPMPAELRHLFRQVRRAAAQAVADGFDWRDVWVAIRAKTPQLWQALPERERAQFLRHAQILWDTHRHRAAPASIRSMKHAAESGKLTIAAGRILHSETEGKRVRLRWRDRKNQQVHDLIVDRILNCSGPSSRIADDRSKLFSALDRQQMLLPCSLGLGVKVDAAYRLLDSSGTPQEGLYYAGPLLKSQHWEATAVPELRLHAEAVARHCLSERNPI
ncbi:FAD/NAD(P)-binding protein [Paucibacter sp. DJ2R-2]|uniref:FAD/NAD(P)-binding protein n=1 Tax=Paucibacter sp. DJ2R-2 TaxID=2893558 RepID=UPI0021E4B99C|nr:FAD/NAD(P)-binding protein [Paucibacter sp. DJ2R-2]MCV2423126.1 FAD/NAD(P)-binding protein [Paucibacter sp. DJ4R-1]MCV2441021.1 FAD/NAD(P)-binding protein [Paucibacter sp. DJ2R-2]